MLIPLRAWCNARVLLSAFGSRFSEHIQSNATLYTDLAADRYTLFCIFRWRRLPRSTALEVAGKHGVARNVRAFQMRGEDLFYTSIAFSGTPCALHDCLEISNALPPSCLII